MGFLVFLIIGAFLFAVAGVVVLLRKSGVLSEEINSVAARIGRIEWRLQQLEEAFTRYEAEAGETAAAGETPAAVLMEGVPAGVIPPVGEAPLVSADVIPPVAEAPVIPAVLPEASPEAVKTPSALGNSLAAFVHGGNLWAVGGILLLLAGFATLITYLANRGFFTVEMGIAGAALSGLVMLVVGWRFRKKRPVYFLLLQGGGIGILYLSIFAAHKLTPYFPPLISLILMSLLIPPAVVLALFQSSQALALLGFLGGFAAPLFLAAGGGNHVFLFAYYGALDLGVLGIGLFRYWKGLNLLAFLGTFILANVWAAGSYEPALFWTAEPFFLGYVLIFTILGIRGFGKKNVRGLDMALVMGTPALGALLQWRIFDGVQHGHALICLIFSAFYIVLALIIWKRLGREMRVFSEAYLGFGALLANLAIPLELAPRITGAVWAAEGLAVFFLGLRADKRRGAAAGIVLHIAAAIAFVFERDRFSYGEEAFRSVRFIGSLIIALSALGIIFLAERRSRSPARIRVLYPAFPIVLGLWAFAWWFGGWFYEIHRTLNNPWEILFLFCSASALAAFGASKFLRCPVYRIGMIPSLIFGLCLALSRVSGYLPDRLWMILSHNFFEGLFLWGWLVFFAVQVPLLVFTRKHLREEIHGLWILIVIFIALGISSSSGRALTLFHGLAPVWTSFAGLFPVFAAMISVSFLARRTPAADPAGTGFRQKLLFFVLPLILSCIMGLWFFVTLFLPGDPALLPFYLPILNPLDLEEAFCVVLFLLWQSILLKRKDLPALKKSVLFGMIDSMAFLFTIAVTARGVHFYGNIPYREVIYSSVFHLAIFILWAVYGIGHIIGGSRLSLRKVWIAGAILTVADIAKFLLLDLAGAGTVTRIVSFFAAGLLLLFIGWAAPLPPAKGEKEGAAKP
jgi:uncharacterized membrane protein